MEAEGTVDVRTLLGSTAPADGAADGVERADTLAYDLGGLAAYAADDVDEAALRKGRESYLQSAARECVQLVFNQLWALADGGPTIALPAPTTRLPREKPLPKPKPPTRWEKFAAAKGIAKRKKERMVYDEATGKWAPRFGYQKANDPNREWLLPAKASDAPGSDPFEQKATARKEARNKQLFNEERNRRAVRRKDGGGGGGAPPAAVATAAAGVPELRGAAPSKEARLKQADVALHAAQRSTASLGKFDRTLAGEPDKQRGQKRKYEPAVTADSSSERAAASKVLDKVLKSSAPAGKPVLDEGKIAKRGKLAHERAQRVAKFTGPGAGGASGSRGRGGARGAGRGRGRGGRGGRGRGRGRQ